MFDNLRDESSRDFDEQAKFQPAAGTGNRKPGKLLGMTSIQRFVIVSLIMFTVCVLGTLLLLATGKFMF